MNIRLSTPRLYSVHITMKSGKIINKMLGVAFTNVDRQRYYDEYRQYAHWRSGWNDSTISEVEFKGEKLNATEKSSSE